MKKKKAWILGLVLVMVLTLAAAGTALAQDTAQTPKSGLLQLFWSKLAANLGIDQSRLEQAARESGLEAVDEAARQGLISQDRADRIKECIESGNWSKMGPFMGTRGGPKGKGPGGWPGRGGGILGCRLDDLASVLGMTPEDLVGELKSGKTLEDIAKTKGLTLEQVREKLVAEAKRVLDEKVAQGQLTEQQAGKILSRLENMDLSRIGKRCQWSWRNPNAGEAPSGQ